MKFLGYMILAAALNGGTGLQAAVISNFDSSDDGWRSVTLAFPDPGTPPAILNTFVPTWHPAGGNPGGYISNPDPNPNVQYWLAPAKFLGNQAGSYAKSLMFSLSDAPANLEFTQADIILTGGGMTLTAQIGPTPTAVWSDYSVALSQGTWKVNSPGGADATEAQLKSVLGSLTGLYIRGEYYLTSDTQTLDSVALQTGTVPEPSSWLMLLSGIGLGLRLVRK